MVVYKETVAPRSLCLWFACLPRVLLLHATPAQARDVSFTLTCHQSGKLDWGQLNLLQMRTGTGNSENVWTLNDLSASSPRQSDYFRLAANFPLKKVYFL